MNYSKLVSFCIRNGHDVDKLKEVQNELEKTRCCIFFEQHSFEVTLRDGYGSAFFTCFAYFENGICKRSILIVLSIYRKRNWMMKWFFLSRFDFLCTDEENL